MLEISRPGSTVPEQNFNFAKANENGTLFVNRFER
jgi:hypothetical protein